MNTPRPRIALTGDVALELVASYFRDAGYEVMPADTGMDVFRPDFVYDVTAHERELADEVPGFYDRRMEKLSGCRFSLDGIRAIIEECAWSRAARRAKVLAVDADNTLWSGILSEDGAMALRPHSVFQTGLAALRDAGAVLVLLSKNDPFPPTGTAGAPPVDSALFAVQKVNWAPKPGNLVEACRELNLGMDSVVFVDDNPHERAQMSAHLPEVAVAPWNGFPTGNATVAERQLVRRLRTYFFPEAGSTAEDRLRAADYARLRNGAARSVLFASHDAYLDDLGLWVRPARAVEGDLDRLAQMAGKTNQFNATTRRLPREAFAALLADPGTDVFTFRAGDRFGEQGLVCYVVVNRAANRITDFVMSCRAMGRTLEYFALDYLTRVLGARPAIDFMPTAKNRPFADFLATLAAPPAHHFKEVL